VSLLSQSELAKLKVKDPFMYYSIPSVRIAELGGNTVDAPLAGTVLQMKRITAELYQDILDKDIAAHSNLMEQMAREVQKELEQKQQEAQEEEEEEEEEEDGANANDDMVQQCFNQL
jgi:hypothetical protein